MNRRKFLKISAFLAAQIFVPLPNVNTMFWNKLSRTQGFFKHELTHENLEVTTGCKLLLFSPHPDDETLAAGGLIQRVIEDEGKVCVIFMTNGDGYVEGVKRSFPNVNAGMGEFIEYGIKRHNEAVHAIWNLGLQEEEGIFMGFPDQGIDSLWKNYWSRLRPYTSPYTKFDHPGYQTSFDKWAKYSGMDLDEELQRIIGKFQPDWVILPDPRDYHPDHSATGVFALDALRRLQRKGEIRLQDMQAFTYLVHYPGYPASNQWERKTEESPFRGSEIIAKALSKITWLNFPLNSGEIAKKAGSLADYETQLQVLGDFMKQFIRPYEVFGSIDLAEFASQSRMGAGDLHGEDV